MTKRYSLIFMVGLISFFLIGCASIETKFKEAEEKGTIAAYKGFLWEYPTGDLAEQAKKRISEIEKKEKCQKILGKLTKIDYHGYVCKIDEGIRGVTNLAVKTIGKLDSFSVVVKDNSSLYAGSLSVSEKENEEIKNYLSERLAESLSKFFSISKEGIEYVLLLAYSEGGFMVGYGGMLTGDVFILDVKNKQVLSYNEVESVAGKYIRTSKYETQAFGKDLQKAIDGLVYKAVLGIRKDSGEFTVDKTVCEKDCRDMLEKGQLRQGVTIEECIKTICK